MTKKLFETDSYIKEFDAVVLDCVCEKGAYFVELDCTAFFPEGGGQLADTGTLSGAKVSDVQEKGGRILHKTDREFAQGETVHGEINWDDRFDRMQNHSGEHLVSGIINSKFGLNNVGFHLGETVTFDMDGTLTFEQLAEVEYEANKAIYENVSITASFPSDEELESMTYRSKIEGLENTRIVTIDGYDCCACCAPHVARTGEIGIIKIVDCFPVRKATRIVISCGFRALEDYRAKHNINKEIMGLLSAKTYEIAEGVKRLLQSFNDAKKNIQKLSGEKALLSLGEITKNPEGYSYAFTDNISSDDMIFCINHCKENGAANMAVFSGNDASGYRFSISSADSDAHSVVKEVIGGLGGRGGGADLFYQGKLQAERSAIEKALSEIKL